MVSYRERNADGSLVPVNVRLSAHAYRTLAAMAAQQDVSMATVVEAAVLRYADVTLQGADPGDILAAAPTNDRRRTVIDRLAGEEPK